jgi:hypothetical protein
LEELIWYDRTHKRRQGIFPENGLDVPKKNDEIDFSGDVQYQIIKSPKIIIYFNHHWIFLILIAAASLFARKAK